VIPAMTQGLFLRRFEGPATAADLASAINEK
jgi:hypothetical protein